MVYRPTARVLTVLELLQARGRMTGAALAERLEVDVRTARAYIETLRDLGIPVEAERGRYGAYYLRPGFKLPPLIFTDDEALALTLSLLLVRRAGLAETTPAVEGALAKIERVLPEATRTRLQSVQEAVVFSVRRSESPPPTEALTVLSEAVQARRAVRLTYAAANGRETERRFDPYGVVANWGQWYTIGYCHLRGGERLFRLDRIQAIEALADSFMRPADYDTLAATQAALAAVPGSWRLVVWLGTTPEGAGRHIGFPSSAFVPEAGGCLLRMNTDDLDRVARDLAGLPFPFTIRHPTALRGALRRHALRLAGEQSDETNQPESVPS